VTAMILPSKSLGVVAYAANDLRVEPVPLREPAADETVIEVAYGGICGSDLHYWMHGAAGESILRAPMVLGHEVVGTVAQAARDGSGPAAGTLVAVHPATPAGDGVTRFPADRPNLSPACTYLGSAAQFPHRDGAFVKYATLPSRMLRPLPPGLGLPDAALVEPASVAWHAVARAGDVKGKSALVIGAGPIGALIVAVLKRGGATEITAVDMHPFPLDNARALGATQTLLATEADEITSVQADVVVESERQPPRTGERHPRRDPRGPGGDGGTAAERRSAGAHLAGDQPGARAAGSLPLQRRDRRGHRGLGRRQPLRRPGGNP
jgi:L-idonate 5-dehydrogenase